MLKYISKLIRKKLGDVTKMCDWCLKTFTWQTPTGELLCEECNKEYYNAKLKT